MDRRRSLAVRAFGLPFCSLISDGPSGRLQSRSVHGARSIISDRSMTIDCADLGLERKEIERFVRFGRD